MTAILFSNLVGNISYAVRAIKELLENDEIVSTVARGVEVVTEHAPRTCPCCNGSGKASKARVRVFKNQQDQA